MPMEAEERSTLCLWQAQLATGLHPRSTSLASALTMIAVMSRAGDPVVHMPVAASTLACRADVQSVFSGEGEAGGAGSGIPGLMGGMVLADIEATPRVAEATWISEVGDLWLHVRPLQTGQARQRPSG